MFKENYKALYRDIKPDEGLINAVAEGCCRRKRKISGRITAALAAAAIVCASLAVPAAAANDEGFYNRLYGVFPAAAQCFKPIHLCDEKNGIQMEVVSAYIHEDSVELYISLRDLTGGRIDETVDLYDSYSINRPFGGLAGCHLAGYDPETSTATFFISITDWDANPVSGDKITFSVEKFLSRKKVYDGVSIPFDLSSVIQAQSTRKVELNGAGGLQVDQYIDFRNNPFAEALVPAEPMADFPVEGVDFTGIGYVDGMLHIQVAVKDPLGNDNHGYFYLKDEKGNEVKSAYTFSFPNHWEEEGRVDYEDHVFDVPREALADYSLYGYFVTAAEMTEGGWSVTFPIEEAQ